MNDKLFCVNCKHYFKFDVEHRCTRNEDMTEYTNLVTGHISRRIIGKLNCEDERYGAMPRKVAYIKELGRYDYTGDDDRCGRDGKYFKEK